MLAKNKLSAAIIAATFVPGVSYATLEEVVVTATKRSESLQDVPIAVSALGELALEQLGVETFTDYLVQLPGVTAGGSGPGQATIYIRGLASTTPNLTTAGVAGLAPNVALYLDEQPVSQPGRNLDVYAADLERVEVLSGPQGTLFGASSQAGTVRLITNKPKLDVLEGSVKLGTSFTAGGEQSNSVEGVINIPVSDQFAVRAVVYADNQGGYIDNVRGTRSARDAGRFRSADVVRSNGVPVGTDRDGFQSPTQIPGISFDGVNFIEATNDALVEEDFNDASYNGFRLTGLYEFNEDWRLTVSHSQQDIDSEGVFFEDPDVGDLQIERFSNDELEDNYENTSWTLNGRIGALDMVYTGAFTDRETEQQVDYTDYLFTAQYLPYYICDGSVTYPGDALAPTGTCQAPNLLVDSTSDTLIRTHEIRFLTSQDAPLRATFGAFYSSLSLRELNDFIYPGSQAAIAFNGNVGFGPNFSTPGSSSSPTPFPAGGIFRNDVLRTDEQLGAFGEVSYDISDQFTVTFGARWYDIEVDLRGSADGSFFNFGATVDQNGFSNNLDTLFDGIDGNNLGRGPDGSNPGRSDVGAPDVAATDGTIFKFNLNWKPVEDVLIYGTWSEGFRPGLLNRPGGSTATINGQAFTVPFAIDTDDVTNWELGWKAELLDNSVRFNGNVFFLDIERLQTTIFDPNITNLLFSDNAADAEILGLEGDITWAVESVPGLTVTSAFSFLDTEITEVITPTGDVSIGDSLAFAPDFQFNVRARYEWDLDSGATAHFQPQIVYSDSSFSDIISINRDEIDDWLTVAVSAGITTDTWTAEVYIDNLTDERAELARNFNFDRQRVTVSRPRTIGFRLGFNFQ
ncbi:TonB-dependent receptor [Porticoccus sp. W117]|uniref:TonB-dependent receptor n=1 Tax=Porticoccus sp. W117 TaxID=3054777 RepID=UPI002597E7B4|nr:TonB-dependent receptor [Porticoccus sp. W117]MDM3871400.1 TonB-dependent receptor [Porticoccus sp. W117]